MPPGIWADVWDLDADTTIFVFYDSENNDTVERAALGQKEEREETVSPGRGSGDSDRPDFQLLYNSMRHKSAGVTNEPRHPAPARSSANETAGLPKETSDDGKCRLPSS